LLARKHPHQGTLTSLLLLQSDTLRSKPHLRFSQLLLLCKARRLGFTQLARCDTQGLTERTSLRRSKKALRKSQQRRIKKPILASIQGFHQLALSFLICLIGVNILLLATSGIERSLSFCGHH
jgi:hypothetical protein